MKNIVKKIAIFSMIGMMQIGFGASVIEASALNNEPIPMQQENNWRIGQHPGDHFEHDRQERERAENERHERQKHENERHERELGAIRDHR